MPVSLYPISIPSLSVSVSVCLCLSLSVSVSVCLSLTLSDPFPPLAAYVEYSRPPSPSLTCAAARHRRCQRLRRWGSCWVIAPETGILRGGPSKYVSYSFDRGVRWHSGALTVSAGRRPILVLFLHLRLLCQWRSAASAATSWLTYTICSSAQSWWRRVAACPVMGANRN